MLLDRIDIDNHGPLTRVELGPFSEYLNVVCTPEGSGKTAIARFVRDSLIQRQYPLGMMSSSAGRVVWADRNGKIHCRREHDGTASGRRTIEFESRGDTTHRFDWLHGSWIEGIADSTDATRALESIRIPESIVDGVVTDTAVTSVSRVIQACLRSGLCDPALFAELPINRSTVSGTSPATATENESERRSLRDELARVEAELATATHHAAPYAHHRSTSETQRRQLEARLAQLHDRIWQLRVRQSELSRWLSHLQADRNRIRYTTPITASPYASAAASTLRGDGLSGGLIPVSRSAMDVDAELRRRLLETDAQIIRWRRVLSELSSLRDVILSRAGRRNTASLHAEGLYAETLFPYAGQLPLTEDVLRRERMNHFFSSLDHFARYPGQEMRWDALAPSSIGSAWPDEIDLRIEAIVRQIDALASHYDRTHAPTPSWYRGSSTLVHSLRAVRDDLQNVRRHGFRFAAQTNRGDQELDELQRSEQWIVVTIQRLFAHRDSLVHDRRMAELVRYPSWLDETYHRQTWSSWYIDHLDREVVARTKEHDEVSSELARCLATATELRRRTRFASPILEPPYGRDHERSAIDAEIHSIQFELQSFGGSFEIPFVDTPRVLWLKNRRAELVEKLGVPQSGPRSASPLADEASQWLVRLSGGRLRRVDWNDADFTMAPRQVAAATQIGFARIDDREESMCPAVDRSLAALAVRLAAADLLARTGRAIPLVVEAHRELLRDANPTGYTGHVNLAVIAALDDFAKSGRQVILLASDQVFAEQVRRRGGQVFSIHGERIAKEHRPLWEPHFADESYIGPHAGMHMAPDVNDPLRHSDAFVNQYDDQFFEHLPIGASLADINRNLDTIWQEAYGVSPYPPRGSMPRPERGYDAPAEYHRSAYRRNEAGDANWHDGYYFADTYTTAARPAMQSAPSTAYQSHSENGAAPATGQPNKAGQRKASPFFLTVDSPIDQAPSVDAVAASRLRRLNVTHINHLMNQDPNRLADSLGLAGVTAATIRRWQSECRLVCHVPQLRGFDARVLVGCGITDAGHLSSTDPIDLLDRVEAFLATERGQRILLSGTSYELSRITSWIAAANINTDDAPAARTRDHHTIDGRVVRQVRSGKSFERDLDNDQYEYEFIDDNGEIVRATSNRSRLRRGVASGRSSRSSSRNGSSSASSSRPHSHTNGRSNGRGMRAPISRTSRQDESGYDDDGQARSSRPSSSRSSSSRSSRSSNGRSSSRSSRGEARRSSRRPLRSENGYSYDGGERRSQEEPSRRENESYESGDTELRFYLERESPIVDAPSIGARMAERLEAVGVTSVDDLLNFDAADLAEQLDHRRIDADVITAWQDQAILVCRIPMLRGHDAQLLVAAEITTPEEVAQYDPQALLELIDPVARSNEGKRIIRGGKRPDLEEITEWISYAGQSRELVAA